MRNRNIRRGLALLGAAVAVAGALAVAQPAQAAPKGSETVNEGGSAVPAAVVVAGRGAAADKTTTKDSGRGTLHLDGACNQYADGTGDFCMWYLAGFVGSYVDFYFADSNMFDNVFISPGAGQGQIVANNAESDVNYDLIYTAWVCTGINYTGNCGNVPPGTGGTFNSIYFNNVESLYWT